MSAECDRYVDHVISHQDHMFMDSTTKDIMSKERIHRTRATVLQSSGKVSSPSPIVFTAPSPCSLQPLPLFVYTVLQQYL